MSAQAAACPDRRGDQQQGGRRQGDQNDHRQPGEGGANHQSRAGRHQAGAEEVKKQTGREATGDKEVNNHDL